MVRLLKWFIGSLFKGVFFCILMLLLPIYLSSPKAHERAMLLYEIQCMILRALRMARFEVNEKKGVLSHHELYERVQDSFKEEVSFTDYCIALNHLVKENAVLMYKVNEVYIPKDGDCVHNVVLLFELNDDSDFTPRKPRKKRKKRKEKFAPVPA